MPDITIALTERLEHALRAAALSDLVNGGDNMCPSVDSEDFAAVDEFRADIAHAGTLLDILGYAAGDHPIASLTAPVGAVGAVAKTALYLLDDELDNPGRDGGHERSARGLRASAELWDQLESIITQTDSAVTA